VFNPAYVTYRADPGKCKMRARSLHADMGETRGIVRLAKKEDLGMVVAVSRVRLPSAELSIMQYRFILCLSFGLTLASGVHAQPDPFVRPLPPASAGTETLGKFLREIGYEPKALSPDVYQITVERELWPVHLMLSLSTEFGSRASSRQWKIRTACRRKPGKNCWRPMRKSAPPIFRSTLAIVESICTNPSTTSM